MNTNEKEAVTTITKKSTDLLDSTVSLTVNDDEQLKSSSSVLGEIKTIAKEVKTRKEAITKPLNEALKEVRALFAVPENNLKQAETAIKSAILAYHEVQDAAAQAEIAKIENRIKPGTGNLSVTSAMQRLSNVDQAETNLGDAQIKYGAEKVRITDALLLIQDHPSLLTSDRVLEALRIELSAEIKAGGRVPQGAELYREKLVAGYAS